MSDPIAILNYWLGEVGEDGWFGGGEDLDAAIRGQFLEIWQAAADGGLDHWVNGAAGALAFLILTDQFPRNMFRGQAAAFSTDAMALGAARRSIAAGWDMDVPEPERMFFYMPFEHSEDAADQALAVQYTRERLPETAGIALHARAHAEIIRRFGRFPYRNEALGRKNTAPELAFMAEGGYGEIVRALKS